MMITHPLQIRLSWLLEAIENEFDATVTSDLNSGSLNKMVWLLTRIKPNVTLSSLRVNYYFEMNAKFRQKYLKLVDIASSGVGDIVQQVWQCVCTKSIGFEDVVT